MISSFKESEISVIRRMMPAVPVALIYDTFSIRHIEDYRSKGYSRISLRKNSVTEHLVKACHAQGITVYVWTVDEQDEMKRCIEWGVDGIYTNRPRVLREMINTK
jgi:glycerophosphoryl diester phosphodiesterase